MIPLPARVEVLEARVAPALLFLSGAAGDLVVRDAAGAVLAGKTVSAAAVGATLAIPLLKGQTLVFDANGNGQLDSGEVQMLSVVAGNALVFVTNFSDGAGGAADDHFEVNEVTGLAVSDAFQGKINTDVNGSIVTALGTDGEITVAANTLTPDPNDYLLNLQAASIAALKIDGQVVGNVFAGDSLSNVNITGQHYNTLADIRSVTGNLATGTAVNVNSTHLSAAPLSFDGGHTVLPVAAFSQPGGVAGGSISNVRLDHGAHNLIAGDGGISGSAAGGRGGSISNVTITMDSADPVWLVAGQGGISGAASGGAGGSISAVTIKLTVDATTGLEVIAGDGGAGAVKGRGGAGGSITGCTLITSGSIAGTLELAAGSAGEANGTGAGGVGGAIVNTDVQLLGTAKTITNVTIAAGTGGDSSVSAGGAGGGLVGCTFLAEATIGDAANDSLLQITAGDGGAGKTAGGAGGALTGDAFFFRGDVVTSLKVNNVSQPRPALIHSGTGGDLQGSSAASALAGRGGAITGLALTQFADVTAGLTISGGDGGGADAVSLGSGGAGGSIFSPALTGFGATHTDLLVKAGAGGAPATSKGSGGAGGSILFATVHEYDTVHSLTLQAGAGANTPSTATGAGGAGGSLKSARVVTGDVTTTVNLIAGAAGSSSNHKGAAGGVIDALTFSNAGTIIGSLQIAAGAGGGATGLGAAGTGGAISNTVLTNAGGAAAISLTAGAGGVAGTSGAGGVGGAVTQLTLRSLSSVSHAVVAAGAGGNGGSSAGAGGAGGKISTLILSGDDSDLSITAGVGGNSTSKSAAGRGGGLAAVTGSAGIAMLTAGAGGLNSGGGAGGAGGSIKSIDFGVVGSFVRALRAGDGGAGGIAGAGGSVSSVDVAGDIGDFTSAFDVISSAGMGGLVAGQRGLGAGSATSGSIFDITADRIAAMLAGQPAANAVTAANAVYKISRIQTSVVGADVNGNGTFDPSPYSLGSGQTVIDGLVVVRALGFTPFPGGLVPLEIFKVS